MKDKQKNPRSVESSWFYSVAKTRETITPIKSQSLYEIAVRHKEKQLTRKPNVLKTEN